MQKPAAAPFTGGFGGSIATTLGQIAANGGQPTTSMPLPNAPSPAYGGAPPDERPPAQDYGSSNPAATPAPLPPSPGPQTGVTSPFASDPGYQANLSQEQLGLPSINNSLNNLIAQRIVAYGDPSLAGQAGFGLDPQAAAFAQQNYLSGNAQLARLDKGHDQARRAIINALAAHGLIDSGDTGYQTGQADQAYGNSVYDAQQSALADILGYRNSAQSQRDALHSATLAALQNAFQNYSTNPAAYGQIPAAVSQLPSQTTSTKPPTIKAPVKAKALVNPYTTGQKRFG